jgi:hypothetical protein
MLCSRLIINSEDFFALYMSVIWVRSNKQANGGLLGETFHETQQEGLAGPGTPASELFSMTIVIKISEDIFSLLLLPNRQCTVINRS